MIVVRGQPGAVEPARPHLQAGFPHPDVGPQFPQFPGQGLKPVRFLKPEVADVPDRCRPHGEQGNREEGWDDIGPRVHVDLEAARRPVAPDADPDRREVDNASHFTKDPDEGRIPLHRALTETGDRNRPSGDRGRGHGI